MHVHTHIRINTFYVHACTRKDSMYMHARTYARIHAFRYTYTHTHIPTYPHTHVKSATRSLWQVTCRDNVQDVQEDLSRGKQVPTLTHAYTHKTYFMCMHVRMNILDAQDLHEDLGRGYLTRARQHLAQGELALAEEALVRLSHPVSPLGDYKTLLRELQVTPCTQINVKQQPVHTHVHTHAQNLRAGPCGKSSNLASNPFMCPYLCPYM